MTKPLPGDERREQYRAAPDSDANLSVELVLGDGKGLPGEIIDATARGIGLVFQAGVAPAIPIGQTVTVTVRSGHLHAPLSVEAIVASRHETPDQRRRHYRVSVDPKDPVQVAGSFDCVMRIRSRSSRAEQIHWGLEFDAQDGAFAAMEDRIQKYVSARQQAELASKVKG